MAQMNNKHEKQMNFVLKTYVGFNVTALCLRSRIAVWRSDSDVVDFIIFATIY